MQLNLTYRLFCIFPCQLRNGKQREGRTPALFRLQSKAKLTELSNHLLMDCSSGKSLWEMQINDRWRAWTNKYVRKHLVLPSNVPLQISESEWPKYAILLLKLFGELSGERSFQRICVCCTEFSFSLVGPLVQTLENVEWRDPKENRLWTNRVGFPKTFKTRRNSLGNLLITIWARVENIGENI